MSLEVVDIQEVMHKVTEGKLVRVQTKESDIESAVRMIETMDYGDLSLWIEEKLFKVEKALLLPENRELRKRWNEAIEINTKIRMYKLRCKALDLLESYNNEYKATDIAYCKTVLSDVLAEGTAAARAKYLTPKTEEGEMSMEDQDEMENLRDQI